jgi:RNA polymerase sigma-70 factor (ECF subfamily)
MSSERDNYKKLTVFFGQEYLALKAYIHSRINTGVNSDAEDILQDAALKLFSGADRYSPIDNVAGFVYHSVKNKIIDILRRKKRTLNREQVYEARLADFTELFAEREDQFSDQLREALKASILHLKPDYREVILAVDFEGLTYRELERDSGIPQGTLMSRRHRAISILHKELASKKEASNIK